jgi:hypothetical protein
VNPAHTVNQSAGVGMKLSHRFVDGQFLQEGAFLLRLRCGQFWGRAFRARAVGPARNSREGATGRGCLLGNRGALRPQETRAGLLEDLLGPRDLTVRGLPFGTRVRRFVARAILWLPAPLLIGASRSHLEPLKAGSGSLPLLALHRYRSARASWISSPPLGSPSRRRSRPREGRIDPRPVAGQRRGEYRHGSRERG